MVLIDAPFTPLKKKRHQRFDGERPSTNNDDFEQDFRTTQAHVEQQ